MNFFPSNKYFFYSNEKKCSEIQLREDFGNFPPTPLNCKNMLWNFNVVKVRGGGHICNYIMIILKILQAAAKDPDLVSTEYLQRLGKTKNYLFLKLLLRSPLSFYELIQFGRSKVNGIAVVIPSLKDERRMTLRIDANKKNRNLDCFVSHEHVHLLQGRLNEKHSKDIKYPDLLISDTKKDDKFLLYLLEKKEVEAKLHEVVLSYYREKKELPLTIEGFLELLAGSKKFGCLIILILQIKGIYIKPDIITYHERDVIFAEEFSYMLSSIKDADSRYKFITEVLTVMYGNLINYYGDEKSSLSFMMQIERPNLYDALYIEEKTPA
ncbi:MAG: hypothetical protein Q7T62_02045 [Undibacterium sp.]|nr:hypothetical protein [Undibacterium sp.]